MEPIRIFVGCASGDDLESQAVLEYSLRLNATRDLSITWMALSRDPGSPFYSDGPHGWQTQSWSTPFSGFRWIVPQLAGFQGRAIYMDSDFIVRGDMAELHDQPFKPGKCVMAKGGSESWRFCMTLFHCEVIKPHIPSRAALMRDPRSHQMMVSRFRSAAFVQPFSGEWNCIDGEDHATLADPAIKAIHYSQENTQPQLRHAIPRLNAEGRAHWFDGKVRRHWRPELEQMFDRLLREAIAAGFKPDNYRPAQLFGRYRLASHAGYSGHRWGRGKAAT